MKNQLNDPDATIVIPQCGFAKLTLSCLRSLRRCEPVVWPAIVVDDGSADAAAEQIRAAKIVKCCVIEQPHRGVTAAWNAGIACATTPFVVLLNNDVLLDGPVVERLMEPLRNRQAMIAGVEWRVEPLIRRELLAGWCFAFEKTFWQHLGGFDESLRLYFSDTDFQCRAMLHDKTRSPPMASAGPLPLRHLAHQTTRHDPQRSTLWHSDRARFVKKWRCDAPFPPGL